MNRIKAFLHKESSVGLLLMAATVAAMVFANTPLAGLYDYFLDTPLEVRLGRNIHIAKPLLLWINDGLMAVFFLLIGLEVKREILEGRLSSPAKIFLPGIAALGGMFVPALFYMLVNRNDPVALSGWAIPAATDIAFALGVLALLGERIPPSLKVFLLALAIMDDLGAILIIALFYSGDLSPNMLLLAAACLVILLVQNRLNVDRVAPYLFVGTLLWIFVLKSGVHATLAGVILAFAIPFRSRKNPEVSPVKMLEHDLHGWVNYAILPLFAFANAGVPLTGLSLGSLFEPVPLGIFLGLVLGKLLGVFGCSYAAVRLGWAPLPAQATYFQLFGVSALCGIGFTMSLFIGGLAFQHTGGAVDYLLTHRVGILAGSLVAGVFGYALLRFGPRSET